MSLVKEYMKYLFEQVSQANTVVPNKRPMEIYIDTEYNKTNLTTTQIAYALTHLRDSIQKQFTVLSPSALIMFPMVYGVIILTGLIANALMIFAFYRSEKLRTLRNVFIINLAISDILLCLICAPLTLLKYIEINWYFGRVLCKLGPGLQTTIVMVTAFSITTIAIDRWQFITTVGKDTSTKLSTFFCILIIWLLAFIVSIPSFTVNDLKIVKLGGINETLFKVCDEMWFADSFKYSYSILTFIFQYILPLIIVTTSNFKICGALNKLPSLYTYRFRIQKNNLSEPSTHIIKFKTKTDKSEKCKRNLKEPVQQELEQNQPELEQIDLVTSSRDCNIVVRDRERFLRSRQLLKAVCLSFALCWLPLLLFNLMLDFSDFHNYDQDFMPTLFLISHLIATLSCILNPIIYGFFNTNFKEEICKIMRCCMRK